MLTRTKSIYRQKDCFNLCQAKYMIDSCNLKSPLGFTWEIDLNENISSIISITTNGLVEYNDEGYQVTGKNQITLTSAPVNGSKIDFVYLY
jgi:hypothetical protein